MRVSQYINDPARAENRIHYIIYKESTDVDRSPRILSFVYADHLIYGLTDKKIFADLFDTIIINIVEIDDVQIGSYEMKVVLLITTDHH